jgi:tetratricopeptide (TPR) repeat protein
MRCHQPLLLATCLTLAACNQSDTAKSGAAPPSTVTTTATTTLLADAPPLEPQRFSGLGDHHRRITTSSPEAQIWFDQGLAFLSAFNHDEARRSFQHAADLDPDCAMAWWGVAISNGPHINFPEVVPDQASAARAALTHAMATTAHASPLERELISALDLRYVSPPPADRRALDEAYAQAMRVVWQRHQDDADVGCWFAEALMDLRPWDLWSHDGQPRPETPEVLATLESAMHLDPRNPLANHLYIHAVEGSPDPGRGTKAADTLLGLCPALGHLVHMPSHIYVLTGRWTDAIASNTKAIAADAAYRQRVPQQDFYRIYMAHNRHMLAFAAMMRGQSQLAIANLRAMVAEIPMGWLRMNAIGADGFYAMPYEALVRFGRWDELLAEPEPADWLPMSRALYHAARGTAYVAKAQLDEARREQQAFAAARDSVPQEETFGDNMPGDVLAVAGTMLDGEIRLREDREAGIAELREALGKEEALKYSEPPAWLVMTRHTLGAALLDAGKPAEAEQIYREDLKTWPGNGWGLYGLATSLKAEGKSELAEPIMAEFTKTWTDADVQISSSCLCLPGK